MKITESVLRKIIKEEILSLDEADVIRRRKSDDGAVTTTRTKDLSSEPPRSSGGRKLVRSIEDVQFRVSEVGKKFLRTESEKAAAVGPDSAFVGPSAAYDNTYNNGVKRVMVHAKRKIPGGEEKFRFFVEPSALKVGDMVVIPELLEMGDRGPGEIISMTNYDAIDYGGPKGKWIPVATVRWDQDAVRGNVPSAVKNIGLAFLLKIGTTRGPTASTKRAEAMKLFRDAQKS
jgi:hypothetical protein